MDYWKKKGIHYLKPVLLFGNGKEALLGKITDSQMFQKLYNELEGKPYGGIFVFNKPYLLIRDLELIKDVMVKSFVNFHNRGFIINEKHNPLGANLIQLSGTKWRNLRAKLTPTFTSGKIKMMFPILAECAEQMIAKLQNMAQRNESIDMKEIVAQLTTNIIGSCAFGLQINSLHDSSSEFRKFGNQAIAPTLLLKLRFVAMQYFPRLIHLVNILEGKDMKQFFIKAVKDMVNYRENNNIKRNDFLQLLIQLRNKGKVENDHDFSHQDDFLIKNSVNSDVVDKITDIELTDVLLTAQCFVFFVAGFETSSTTASYCLYELAINPDIQEQLRNEVDSVLKEHNCQLSYEAIQKMKYLDQVVDETLRKYPLVGRLDRICTKPYNIPGTDVILDTGVRLAIPVHGLHHDPQYYPDPERFDPERFSPDNKSSRPPFVYLPFGEGPRICIGMRFGLIQTKMAIAALLSKYEFAVRKNSSAISF